MQSFVFFFWCHVFFPFPILCSVGFFFFGGGNVDLSIAGNTLWRLIPYSGLGGLADKREKIRDEEEDVFSFARIRNCLPQLLLLMVGNYYDYFKALGWGWNEIGLKIIKMPQEEKWVDWEEKGVGDQREKDIISYNLQLWQIVGSIRREIYDGNVLLSTDGEGQEVTTSNPLPNRSLPLPNHKDYDDH